jgi:DNA modification methylase
MTKQLSLIEEEHTLSSLPSAKIKASDKVGVHSWTNFYASFSESFVNSAIEALEVKESETIFDPFVGSGTTTVAAWKKNISAVGVDIDPFSCLLSRTKFATKSNFDDICKLLKKTKSQKILSGFTDEAKSIFDDNCLRYASKVFSRVVESVNNKKSNVLDVILNDSEGIYDSEAVALTALCIGSAESAKLVKGSNPTWYRKAIEGEKDNIEALYEATSTVCDQILLDLAQTSDHDKKPIIFNGDIKGNIPKIKKGFADVIITSPPYLTRIDYAVKHLPNLSILSGFIKLDFTDLRKSMIGTPKIVKKGEFDSKWGTLCITTLNAIKDHASYASESYYIWTYYQYFDALYQTFINFKSYMKSNGRGIIILQDSFYKELHIPLSKIAVEMLKSLDMDAGVVVKDQVKNNMKQLNPAHQKKNIKLKASEDVIYFRRCN